MNMHILVMSNFASCSTFIAIYCKPLMFACRLFRKLNKTAKLEAVNIDTTSTLIGITRVLE